MTLDQFWNQEPALVIPYRRAEEHRLRRRERELWSQGLYLRSAVASLLCEGASYPEAPLPVTKDEAEARRRQQEAARLALEKAHMAQWVAEFQRRKEGEAHGDRD